jgi:uncharacterized protein YbaP (TraB family)
MRNQIQARGARCTGLSLRLQSLLLALFIWCCLLPCVFARLPIVFELSHEGHTAELVGTIHLPDPKVTALDLSPLLERADALYTEIRLDEAMQAKALAAFMYQDERTLHAEVPAEWMQRLQAVAQRTDPPVPFYLLLKMKPQGAAMMLELLPATLKYAGHESLDQRLYNEAARLGVRQGALETLQEQIRSLESFDSLALLQMTIESLEAQQPGEASMAQTLMSQFLEGDLLALKGSIQGELAASNDPAFSRDFYTAMFSDRDQRMAQRILAAMREHPGEHLVFAVGCGHLIEGGIPDILRAKGVTVQRRP